MGGFVRMTAFRKTMSDDEFVAYLRSDLPRRPRRRSIMLAVGFAAILLGMLWMLIVPATMLTRLAAQESPSLPLAVVGGAASGAAAAAFILIGVRLLAESLGAAERDRTARLLLECYGRLHPTGPEAEDLTGR